MTVSGVKKTFVNKYNSYKDARLSLNRIFLDKSLEYDDCFSLDDDYVEIPSIGEAYIIAGKKFMSSRECKD